MGVPPFSNTAPFLKHWPVLNSFRHPILAQFDQLSFLIGLLGVGRSPRYILKTSVVLDPVNILDVVAGLGDAPHGLPEGSGVVVV